MVQILKSKLCYFGAGLSVLLLMGAGTGVIRWDQINPLFRNGTDAFGQSSDGTHVPGNIPTYDSLGGLTQTYGAQGTDTNLLTAGTVSGTGATLCTDANGGATTVSCSGGGGSASAIPPYISIGGTPFIAANMASITLPNLTGFSFLGSPTTTNTTAANGNIQMVNSGSVAAYYGKTASTSVVADFFLASYNGAGGTPLSNFFEGGVWMWDSTNNFLYVFQIGTYSNESALGSNNSPLLAVQKYTYSGSGTPTFSANLFTGGSVVAPVLHCDFTKSGSTITATVTIDGIGTPITVFPITGVGTVTKAGLFVFGNSVMNLLSLNVI